MREYDTVRVTRLARPDREYDGTPGHARPPAVGDSGTIVHEYDPDDPTAPVVVECVDAEGHTIWLADFERSELTGE